MSKYGCGIKVHSSKISFEILCSKHTLARNKVSQNSPKSASKGSVVLYGCKVGLGKKVDLTSGWSYLGEDLLTSGKSRLVSKLYASLQSSLHGFSFGSVQWEQEYGRGERVRTNIKVPCWKGNFYLLILSARFFFPFISIKILLLMFWNFNPFCPCRICSR